MRHRQTLRKSSANRTQVLLFRILPTAIFLAALIGSILVGYNAHVSLRSSPFRTSSYSNVPRLRIGAYYYAWYKPKQWSRWKTKFQPALGLYDSPNSTVLTTHSEWASRAGIDFFVMSWSTQEEHDTIKEYLQHPKTIPIALHIESQILYLQSRVNRTQPENGTINFDEPCVNIYSKKTPTTQNNNSVAAVTTFGETFIAYMIKMMNEIVIRYRQKYLFVGDRPVFVLYLAREFDNFEPYFERLQKYFQTRFGIRPYLIADVVWFARDKKVQHMMRTTGKDHWDSITGYNRYEGRKDESLDEYLDRTELEYLRYSYPFRWWDVLVQKTRTVPVVPYVQPGYDDRLIRADQHGTGIARPAYDRLNGQTFHRFWDLAERLLHNNPCTMKSEEWFVFVTSFNEWHESTAIEPSLEWGDQYLKLTKERSKTLYPACGTV